jgi:signal transduction histidine kinase/putative methionine-R-sulfoxide reductase with GAF domain
MSTEGPIDVRDPDGIESLVGPIDGESKAEQIRALKALVVQQEAKIASILEISNALRATRTESELLDLIAEKIALLMDADRSTLFLKDEEAGELWTKVTEGARTMEIRLALGQGIAGWVAQTGQSINIKNAYRDPRFNPDIDFRTGYETKSILCQPMRNQERRIIGVIQVLNKRHGYFTVDDELLLSSTAAQAAIVIENGGLYHSVLEANYELNEIREALEKKLAEQDMLVDLQRSMSQSVSMDGIARSVAEQTLQIVPSQACAVTLKGQQGYLLYLLQQAKAKGDTPELQITRSIDQEGPSALVIDQGIPYVCNSKEQIGSDSTLTALGLELRTVAVVPLSSLDSVFGSIGLINKRGLNDNGVAATYSDADLKLLTLLSAQVAPAIATQLFRSEQELADRLASVGRMLSGVLHDFKTPVTVISGYVQLMAKEDSSDSRKAFAANIAKQFASLNQMTTELLSFARGDSTILLRKVYLSKFMTEVEEHLRQEFEGREIDLKVLVNYRRTARFDEGKMKRAIFNVARNAVEAMSRGGHFIISLDAVDEETLRFRFKDSGQGIPVDIRGRLFESFVTFGKNNGTGLGLAIVKKIVDEHNGQIDFESIPGEGTTFEIRIPIAP